MIDEDCICKGNWRQIVRECTPLLDRVFVDKGGRKYTFFGIVHASDDYCYGMIATEGHEVVLLTCVGSISNLGYRLLHDDPSIENNASYSTADFDMKERN